MVKNAQDAGVALMKYRICFGLSPFMVQPMALIDMMLAFVKVMDGKH